MDELREQPERHQATTNSDNDTEKQTVDRRLSSQSDSEGSSFKQEGVRQVEAITSVWTNKMLWVTFVLLYLVSFVDSLLQSVQYALTPYVTSAFSQHGLLATTSIVSSVLGGVWGLAVAKVIDIWGRLEGFVAMIFLIVLGMIMKATCNSVQMYAAAHTLYWVGHGGLIYVIDVVLADMTTLQNRMIMITLNGTPLIASTFAGPRIAQLFLENVNFRWAFGAFCIILVAFCIPVVFIFYQNHKKALAEGVIQKQPSGRTFWGSCKFYFWEFDVVGMVLTTAGWSLLLLPFNLVNTAPQGWKTGYIIAMIVLGVASLAAFVVWEKWFSPVPYFPFKFLRDRTVLGACLLYGLMFTSIFAWDAYYNSYLQVVHGLDVTISGYVLNTFSLTSSFISPFVGLLIRFTGRYKWPSLIGIPFVTLGTVLLIHFRRPETPIGYLVMCQFFNGIGTGIWATTAQISIMASVNHQEIAVAIALWGLFASIGSAIGNAIAGALWTNIFPGRLMSELPEESKNLTMPIYGDITTQLSYTEGPIRDAIVNAYAHVQRLMVISGAAFLPLLIIFVLMWKNIDLRKRQQEQGQSKGNVW